MPILPTLVSAVSTAASLVANATMTTSSSLATLTPEESGESGGGFLSLRLLCLVGGALTVGCLIKCCLNRCHQDTDSGNGEERRPLLGDAESVSATNTGHVG